MNCRKDDWAVVVRKTNWSGPEVGTLVRCYKRENHPYTNEPGWLLYEPLANGDIGIVDRVLRPLRDNPGEDETLQWLKVPATDLVVA